MYPYIKGFEAVTIEVLYLSSLETVQAATV